MRKLLNKNKVNHPFLVILLAFVIWRVWLQFFYFLGWLVMPLNNLMVSGGDQFFKNPGLWVWSNFDGEHYLAVAQHGYGHFEQAFFPFYPFLVKTFTPLFGSGLIDYLTSSLILSHLFFLLALLMMYKLVVIDYKPSVALWSVIFLLVFPTSFFFAASYTESLFLALTVGSFYAARKGHWFVAGLLGMFASGTKLMGIILLPALLWEYHEQTQSPPKDKSNKPSSFSWFFLFLIPIGLLDYMRFLWINYQDPLLFINSQPAFGAHRSIDKIILFYQVFWRYLKMLATTSFNQLYYTLWLEFVTTMGVLVMLVVAYLKKVRLSYLVFGVSAWAIPTLTGTFSSMPRYVLIVFPFYLTLALINSKFFRWAFVVMSLLLLAISTIFFTKGYFVG